MADPIRRAEKFILAFDPHIQRYLIGTPPTTHEAALASDRSWEMISEEQRAAQARTAARRVPPALPTPPVPLAFTSSTERGQLRQRQQFLQHLSGPQLLSGPFRPHLSSQSLLLLR